MSERCEIFVVAATALKHYIVSDFSLSTVTDVNLLLSYAGLDGLR